MFLGQKSLRIVKSKMARWHPANGTKLQVEGCLPQQPRRAVGLRGLGLRVIAYTPQASPLDTIFPGLPCIKRRQTRFSSSVPKVSLYPPSSPAAYTYIAPQVRHTPALQVIMQFKKLLSLTIGAVASAQSLTELLASQNSSLSALTSISLTPRFTLSTNIHRPPGDQPKSRVSSGQRIQHHHPRAQQ
jgi:hypothetical protein